ncbi:MAG: NUDIX hydrolase [Eubacteriales bacterium]|nr:NUDIX hydrolase [Eubacteriales bacterium]
MKALSSGGVVIYRGKALLLYKYKRRRYDAWVLPKGTVEENESLEQTALREVEEETGVKAGIMAYLGFTEYDFRVPGGRVDKKVHWYLMHAKSFFCKPQAEEYFIEAGYFSRNAAKFLLKFDDELRILERGFQEFHRQKRLKRWPGGQ